MSVQEMVDASPKQMGAVDTGMLASCIQACLDCAQVCTACADACLSEDGVANLRSCIRTDLDCAEVCHTTARVLTRLTPGETAIAMAMLQACAQACHACAADCREHAAMHEHCRICAEACERCEQACRDLTSTLG